MDIGIDGVWLVTVIVHTEDACRYRKAPVFWNDNLMQVCGFGKWTRLDKARKAAEAAGWLHYRTAGPRKPGTYWGDIPAAFREIDDTFTGESIYPDSAYDEGYKRGYDQGYKEGHDAAQLYPDSGYDQGHNGGYEQGHSSTLSPNPIPMGAEAGAAERSEPLGADSQPPPPQPPATGRRVRDRDFERQPLTRAELQSAMYVEAHEVEVLDLFLEKFDHVRIWKAVRNCQRQRKAKGIKQTVCLSDLRDELRESPKGEPA
jgi:hypothetical protein